MTPNSALALLLAELDADTVRELIAQYLGDTPAQIAVLREAAGQGDLQTLGRTAHSIAGSSATFGLEELRAICLALEEAALAGATAQIATGIEAVATAYAAAIPVLKQFSGQ
ncbi:MAG TPA: Hpt domain-containing protein [Chthoniobacter sp.]|jgi:HPt (histidine-containing phosphotransfer) domain-containing protein